MGIAGLLVGIAFGLFFDRLRMGSAYKTKEDIVALAKVDAENIRKEQELRGKEELISRREELEKETNELRNEIREQEKRLDKRETLIEDQQKDIRKKENMIEATQNKLTERQKDGRFQRERADARSS